MEREKFLYVFLTIDGTSYLKSKFEVRDPNLSLERLINVIINEYGLPLIDNGGNPIKYLIGKTMDDGEEPEILEFEDEDGREQTLIDYNIQPGDHLHLISVPIAGGRCVPDVLTQELVVGMEEMNYDCSIMDNDGCIDNSNDGCIEDSFASTEHLKEEPLIGNYEEPTSAMKGGVDEGVIYDSGSCTGSCNIGDGDGAPAPRQSLNRETYGLGESEPVEKRSIWKKFFGRKDKEEVHASAYAPAEIMLFKHFIVRVFIHRPKEAKSIDRLVKDVDQTAVKKANKSLDVPVKNGDKITIHLSMTDGVVIDEPIQEFVWKGHYIECDFGCEMLKRHLNSVFGKAIIAINNVPRGDLKLTIDVVSREMTKVYAPVEPRRYSKIFISYAHADYSQVRGIAEGCRMNGTDYFFDRHTLQAGDIFKDKILQYIDNADLFVLCWSKNAAESEWVQIERKHALELIERGNHRLSIYPLSMPPEAPLPKDMSGKYNFATL